MIFEGAQILPPVIQQQGMGFGQQFQRPNGYSGPYLQYPQPGVPPPVYPTMNGENRYSSIPGQMVMQSMPSPQQVFIVKKNKKLSTKQSTDSIFSNFSLF